MLLVMKNDNNKMKKSGATIQNEMPIASASQAPPRVRCSCRNAHAITKTFNTQPKPMPRRNDGDQGANWNQNNDIVFNECTIS